MIDRQPGWFPPHSSPSPSAAKFAYPPGAALGSLPGGHRPVLSVVSDGHRGVGRPSDAMHIAGVS